jgi:hypothetical protein
MKRRALVKTGWAVVGKCEIKFESSDHGNHFTQAVVAANEIDLVRLRVFHDNKQELRGFFRRDRILQREFASILKLLRNFRVKADRRCFCGQLVA